MAQIRLLYYIYLQLKTVRKNIYAVRKGLGHRLENKLYFAAFRCRFGRVSRPYKKRERKLLLRKSQGVNYIMLTKSEVINRLSRYGILPVINITELKYTLPLVCALSEGGLPLIEVTLRSEHSLEAIKIIKSEYPDMLVGAGTVLTSQKADEAIAAGADMIVSPGYDRELVRCCNAKNISIIPGCSSASEIQDAVNNGVSVVKFFPSELSGGMAAIRLLSGPFPGVKFLPTGGITLENLGGYLSSDKIIACGGSFMANGEMLKNEDYGAIKNACEASVAASLGFKLAHIGINHDSREEAEKTAKRLAALFGFNTRECSTSVFAGAVAECMENHRFGTLGHIGISTRSMLRAMAYLEKRGGEFDESSFKRDKSGNITCAYFSEEIAGFAIHIVKE